jgi:hypothetical protein
MADVTADAGKRFPVGHVVYFLPRMVDRVRCTRFCFLLKAPGEVMRMVLTRGMDTDEALVLHVLTHLVGLAGPGDAAAQRALKAELAGLAFLFRGADSTMLMVNVNRMVSPGTLDRWLVWLDANDHALVCASERVLQQCFPRGLRTCAKLRLYAGLDPVPTARKWMAYGTTRDVAEGLQAQASLGKALTFPAPVAADQALVPGAVAVFSDMHTARDRAIRVACGSRHCPVLLEVCILPETCLDLRASTGDGHWYERDGFDTAGLLLNPEGTRIVVGVARNTSVVQVGRILEVTSEKDLEAMLAGCGEALLALAAGTTMAKVGCCTTQTHAALYTDLVP